MASAAQLRAAAERTVREAAGPGARVSVLRRFDAGWVTLAGEVERVPLQPAAVHPNDAARLGPDWALAPLADRDGALFGAVFASDVQPAAVAGSLLAAATSLEAVLFPARAQEEADRLADLAPGDGEMDLESGTGSAGYWRRLLAAEEARARAMEHTGTVLLVAPVARAGTRWLAPSVAALRRSCRSVDVLARPDPDTLAVLAVECPAPASVALADRLRASLLDVGIAVGCAGASRRPGGGLAELLPIARDRLEADLSGRRVLTLDPGL